MKFWIVLLLVSTLLTGCITTREVVYREPYRDPAPYYEEGYTGQSEYYDSDDGYRAPSYSHGDYYYSPNYSSTRVNYSFGVSYFDYPLYYSVFWPINHWYYDPFAYPGYYYGVTWFPRSYLSLSLSFGHRGGSYGSLYYSPYRYAWVDQYYDWRPWYSHYPSYRRYYPTPRYGDARIEAARLADLRRSEWPRPRAGYDTPRQSRQGRIEAPAYQGNRRADYGRQVPDYPQKGYGTRDEVRRVNAGVPRVPPQTGAFGNPTTDRGAIPSRLDRPRETYSGGQREINRVGAQRQPVDIKNSRPGIIEREANDRRGYALPGNRAMPDRQGESVSIPRYESRPAMPARTVTQDAMPQRTISPPRAPVQESRSYEPMPQMSRPSAPVRSAPMPTRSATFPSPDRPMSAPVSPPPSAPALSRPSRSEDGVRRVGSSRQED